MAQGYTSGVPISISTTMSPGANTLVPSQLAVKTYAVPYTGALGSVNLGAFGLTTATLTLNGATFPTSVGSSGNILTSNGTNWVSSAPAAAGVTSIAGTSNQIAASAATGAVTLSLVGPYTPATYTAHGVLIGAAATSIVTTTAGTSGQILQSGGASVDPTWTTATYPATAGTSGKVLISNGTNIVSSTPTFPNLATGTGTILRADGTNWVATTSTYPNTNAVSTLLYASSANVMAALATANSGVLTTDASGVPSIDTTNFVRQTTGMQMKGNNTNTAPPAGFIGQEITANASAVSLTTSTAANVTSISLTAGIWDVYAMAYIVPTGIASFYAAQITSSTGGPISGNGGIDYATLNQPLVSGYQPTLTCIPLRVLLSGTTTYYLVAQCNFTTGTTTVNGKIKATRVG